MAEPLSDPADAGEKLVLASPDDASTLKDFLLWAGVMVLIVLTVFSPAMHGKFIWDDDRHVEGNRNLRDFTGLTRIWTKFGASKGGTPQYYPLTHTTYWVEYQLSGAQPGQINPTIFHITNMLLHAGAAILLWFILRWLKIPGAWVAAAIFAVHPMQAESVAWISERKNVLAGVFYFGAILAYLRAYGRDANDGESKIDYQFWGIALGLFICALLSKTVSVSMPAVALLLIWYRRGRLGVADIFQAVPFFAVGLVMAWLTSWIEKSEIGAAGPEWQLSAIQRIIIAGRAVGFYASKIIWPANLSFIYSRWSTEVIPLLWIYPIGVVVILILLWALRKTIGRGPITAALIFVGVLVPALGFINFYPMRYSFVANHFQYLAAPALITLIVAVVARAMRKLADTAPAAPYVVAGIVLVAAGALAMIQSTTFAGMTELWGDTARKNPDSWMVRNNYGVSLTIQANSLPPEEAGPKLDEAINEFKRVIELKPDHPTAYVSWAQALMQQGKAEEAVQKFDAALKLKPDNLDAIMNRGRALFTLGKIDEALAAFRRSWALAQTPEVKPYVGRLKAGLIQQYLGKIYVAKKDTKAALAAYAEAVRIAQEAGDMRFEYGTLLAQEGKKTEAAAQFASAIELQPTNIEAYISLGTLMIDVGNLRGAQIQLVTAARLDPNNPRLMEAAKKFDVKLREMAAAATRPSTTRSTTTQAATTRSATLPTTQPAR